MPRRAKMQLDLSTEITATLQRIVRVSDVSRLVIESRQPRSGCRFEMRHRQRRSICWYHIVNKVR